MQHLYNSHYIDIKLISTWYGFNYVDINLTLIQWELYRYRISKYTHNYQLLTDLIWKRLFEAFLI